MSAVLQVINSNNTGDNTGKYNDFFVILLQAFVDLFNIFSFSIYISIYLFIQFWPTDRPTDR